MKVMDIKVLWTVEICHNRLLVLLSKNYLHTTNSNIIDFILSLRERYMHLNNIYLNKSVYNRGSYIVVTQGICVLSHATILTTHSALN